MPPRDPSGPLDDRNFGTVENAVHFTRLGHGPVVVDLVVNANVRREIDYPAARIHVGQATNGTGDAPPDFGGVCLTIDQAADLIKMLRAAIAAVVKGCPPLAVRLVDTEPG